jgi:outer membrane protein TolC
MKSNRSLIALLCTLLLIAPAAGFAADPPHPTPAPTPQDHPNPLPPAPEHGFLGKLTTDYRPVTVPPVNEANSGRLEALLRGGNLYLSIADTIALVLENNLDIAIQRYGPALADAAVLQAEAGSFARGVSTSVTAGPSSASVSSSGTTPGTNQNAVAQASAGSSTAVGASVLNQSGPSIPSLDPMLTGSLNWAHATVPQSNTIVSGTSASITRQDQYNFGIQKGFVTGTIVNVGLNNSTSTTNSPRSIFNPATTSSLGVGLTQHLLQGFGTAVNTRQIHISKNNREVADLTVKLQVETTVSAVMKLYWDLVSFNENVRVAQEAITAATRLWEDNKRQVEVGTLAPIEVTRAEAQIAAGQQQLTIAQTNVLQQETIIKTALSRTGIMSPSIADAHIIPTDPISIPDVEPIAPIQDLTAMAISSRPELAQSRIQLNNQELTMKGSRNGLLPTLDLVANVSNNALAGQQNPLLAPGASANPYFIGGYSTVLQQLFARNFPNYSVGLNLNIPIWNRAAQGQAANDEVTYRQQQLALLRLENQVRVDVQNSLIGLMQARAQYQAALKASVLQAQTLDAEQKKLALGASTIYNVIQDQQALTLAQSNEVSAKAAYAKAKVEMDRSTGQILTNNNISMDEAYKGVVARPPSPIPATVNPPAPIQRQPGPGPGQQ